MSHRGELPDPTSEAEKAKEYGCLGGLILGVALVVVAIVIKANGGLEFLGAGDMVIVFGGIFVGIVMIGVGVDAKLADSRAVSPVAPAAAVPRPSVPVAAPSAAAGRWVSPGQWLGYSYGRTSGRVQVRCGPCGNNWDVENRLSNTLAVEQEQLRDVRRRHEKHKNSMIGMMSSGSPYAREAELQVAQLENGIQMTLALLSCPRCRSRSIQLKA